MKIEIPAKYKTKKEKLGYIGEVLVRTHFGGTLSEKKYDSEKDITHEDGVVGEVKAQNRNVKLNVFSIRAPTATKFKNQIVKCQTVEKLYFVEYNLSDKFRIYECHDREDVIEYTAYMGNDIGNVNMIGWPISKMTMLVEVEDAEVCEQMRSYSQANTLMKDFPNE